MPLRIGIAAGEASGDLLGAAIIRKLKKLYPDAEITGVAGPQMLAAGARTLFPLEKLSVMGFTEVLFRLRELLRLRAQVKNYFLTHPPDVYIGIDAPDFNLPVEYALKKTGIKTVHCNSPTIWAWRKNRIHKIGRSIDLMLTLFPFEAPYYAAENIPVKYIGHPLADMISIEPESILSSPLQIALLPGSRAGEIKYIGPLLLKAAKILQHTYPDCSFVSPMINPERYAQFEQQWKTFTPSLPLQLVLGKAREVIKSSHIVALASGTATLEALLFKRPMVVVYKSSFISYWIAKQLIHIKQISLPNILGGKLLIPEFIQHEATPENIARSIEDYILCPEKIIPLQQKFTDIHLSLKQHSAQKAAAAIQQILLSSASIS
jgi:lipid-A-disaccharide synthase